jgi:hypothetical protein
MTDPAMANPCETSTPNRLNPAVLQNFRIQTDAAPDEKSYFRGVAHTPKLGGRIVVTRRR